MILHGKPVQERVLAEVKAALTRGGNLVIPPGGTPISQMSPSQIRGEYILYIGAGAVAALGAGQFRRARRSGRSRHRRLVCGMRRLLTFECEGAQLGATLDAGEGETGLLSRSAASAAKLLIE